MTSNQTPQEARAALLRELTHALAWLDNEARDLQVCAFPKRDAKARRALEAVKAAIEAIAPPQAVPDGWKLVPKVATAAMLQASWQFADPKFIACDHEYHIAQAWGAMLAAAPISTTAHPAPCKHQWKVTQSGVTYHDTVCELCGITERTSWD